MHSTIGPSLLAAQPTSQDSDEIIILNGAPRRFFKYSRVLKMFTIGDIATKGGNRKRSASPIELRPKKQRLLETTQVSESDSEKKDGALKVKDLFKVCHCFMSCTEYV